MQHRLVAPTLLGACVALAGCGGGGSSPPDPQNTPPLVITFSHAYPAHQVTAVKGTPWMITNIATTLSGAMYIGGSDLYDTLRVDVTVSPTLTDANLPLPGSDLTNPNGFGLQLGIDSDGNSNTGGLNTCAFGSSKTPFEFGSGSGTRFSDGNYPIFTSAGVIYQGAPNPPAEAVTSIRGSVISQSFFLPTIRVFSGKTIPHIGIEASIFNGADSTYADCQPSSGAEQFSDQ